MSLPQIAGTSSSTPGRPRPKLRTRRSLPPPPPEEIAKYEKRSLPPLPPRRNSTLSAFSKEMDEALATPRPVTSPDDGTNSLAFRDEPPPGDAHTEMGCQAGKSLDKSRHGEALKICTPTFPPPQSNQQLHGGVSPLSDDSGNYSPGEPRSAVSDVDDDAEDHSWDLASRRPPQQPVSSLPSPSRSSSAPRSRFSWDSNISGSVSMSTRSGDVSGDAPSTTSAHRHRRHRSSGGVITRVLRRASSGCSMTPPSPLSPQVHNASQQQQQQQQHHFLQHLRASPAVLKTKTSMSALASKTTDLVGAAAGIWSRSAAGSVGGALGGGGRRERRLKGGIRAVAPESSKPTPVLEPPRTPAEVPALGATLAVPASVPRLTEPTEQLGLCAFLSRYRSLWRKGNRTLICSEPEKMRAPPVAVEQPPIHAPVGSPECQQEAESATQSIQSIQSVIIHHQASSGSETLFRPPAEFVDERTDSRESGEARGEEDFLGGAAEDEDEGSCYWNASTMAPLNAVSAAAIARLRAYKPPPFPLWDRLPLSRRAAVLMLLYADRRGDLRVVITMRAAGLRNFSGHAALPGGKADTLQETPYQIARREAWEEIGLPLDDSKLPPPFRIEHLCYLPMNLARTEVVVRPCVALLHTGDAAVTDPGPATSPLNSSSSAPSAPPTSTSASGAARSSPRVEESLIPRLDAKEVAAVFSAPFHNFLRATDEAGPAGSARQKLPPGPWYEGNWTTWHDSPWRVHFFYVPVTDQTVVKPGALPERAPDEHRDADADADRGSQRYKVWGMTARILVDAATVAYGEEPEFEHNEHFGDEALIEKLAREGRLGEKKGAGGSGGSSSGSSSGGGGNLASEDPRKRGVREAGQEAGESGKETDRGKGEPSKM
ncbi:hypothetical protein VTH06DRAFT_774 [Thermothelomyces fergusii]